MVTIKMVAEKCGLSVAAVSKALNNRPGIGAEKAALVREMAREMGYFPNAAAQTLKTNRSKNLGILFQNELAHEYFSMILEAIRSTAEAWGYDFTLLTNRGQGGFYEHAKYRNCDGVVIVHAWAELSELQMLLDGDTPVVSIDRIFPGRTAVISDNVESTQALVKYLFGLGHTRLAFIHGEEGDVTRMRLAGFYRGCRDCGLEVPEDFVMPTRYHEPEDCEKAVKSLMDRPVAKRPSCILLPDDVGYLGASTALESLGLSVPEDVSCFGYDGIHMTRVLRPSLATYEPDARKIGQVAAEHLLRTIEEPKTFVAEVVTVPGHIRPGGTVKDLTKG